MYTRKIYPIDYYPSPTDTVFSANTFNDLLYGNFKNSLHLINIKPYKGMIVCVKNELKIYLLTEEDITKSQNWMHIGEFNFIKKEK